jgi:hypothetical protein
VLFLSQLDRQQSVNTTACMASSVLLHYFLLASLCWMMCEAFQLYLAFVSVFPVHYTANRQLACYAAVGWGIPALVVVVSAAAASGSYTSPSYCWIDGTSPLVWALYGPGLVVLAVNLTIWLKVLHEIRKCGGNMVMLRASVALGALVGVGWGLGIAVVVSRSFTLELIFILVNASQGVS